MTIDIEGGEKAAFEGATEFLREGPGFIFIETKYDERLLPFLNEKGYVTKSVLGADQNAWLERADMEQCLVSLS